MILNLLRPIWLHHFARIEHKTKALCTAHSCITYALLANSQIDALLFPEIGRVVIFDQLKSQGKKKKLKQEKTHATLRTKRKNTHQSKSIYL